MTDIPYRPEAAGLMEWWTGLLKTQLQCDQVVKPCRAKGCYESVHALIQCPVCGAASPMTRTHGSRSQGLAQGSRNCQHPLDHRKSKRIPEKHLLLLHWLHQRLWLCGSQQIVGKFLEMWIPDHPTCHLRKLYAGQEATVTTRHGTMDWFQTGKRVHQGCILSPCLFNFHGALALHFLDRGKMCTWCWVHSRLISHAWAP